ncbi:DUF1127 domain-containing protein [Afifella marina]|uniref:Uncharacterized conserved protein YjiS, DUF1127 family n=1 Tax=Afifella marina DSM 2698 TaxID=1120955 RepID=A0A1G5P8N4_AFIMA|nr:DUF1127 domain-containing protein [Afifella marina DSM 2698]MBK1628890.1 DUF1127 domain-containing protein [Afifella marina]MBK5916892.1 hypothetical protein [Afifella marina]RAI17894.1 hypothetical protein CH311_16770 [Afifella marina DSM 2698]SCZ45927.1 Uncharacterized conserved protein YjiS, DUF1127 family [Afifella marina DSM 2698]
MGSIATFSAVRLSRFQQAQVGMRVLVVRLSTRLALTMERRRTRRALLSLTDDQLKDIGVSRADAYREGIRRPWDV